MDFGTVAILGLATFSLARLVAKERGPFDIFKKFRAHFQKNATEENWIAEGVACIACLSFWIGLILAALYYTASPVFWVVAGGSAARGIAFFIARYLGDIK